MRSCGFLPLLGASALLWAAGSVWAEEDIIKTTPKVASPVKTLLKTDSAEVDYGLVLPSSSSTAAPVTSPAPSAASRQGKADLNFRYWLYDNVEVSTSSQLAAGANTPAQTTSDAPGLQQKQTTSVRLGGTQPWKIRSYVESESSFSTEKNGAAARNRTGFEGSYQVNKTIGLRGEVVSEEQAAILARDSYRVTLEQKLGQSPFLISLSPAVIEERPWHDTVRNGHEVEGALRWDAQKGSSMLLGTRLSRTEAALSQWEEHRDSIFTQWNQKLSPAIDLLVRMDYEQGEKYNLTSGDAISASDAFTWRVGKSVTLGEFTSAHIEFSQKIQNDPTSTATPVQDETLSLSLQSKF